MTTVDDVVQRKPKTFDRVPCTATVSSSTAGVYVVPIDGDPRNPIGPCFGVSTVGGDQIQEGTVVLLIFTQAGPWVAMADGGL